MLFPFLFTFFPSILIFPLFFDKSWALLFSCVLTVFTDFIIFPLFYSPYDIGRTKNQTIPITAVFLHPSLQHNMKLVPWPPSTFTAQKSAHWSFNVKRILVYRYPRLKLGKKWYNEKFCKKKFLCYKLFIWLHLVPFCVSTCDTMNIWNLCTLSDLFENQNDIWFLVKAQTFEDILFFIFFNFFFPLSTICDVIRNFYYIENNMR